MEATYSSAYTAQISTDGVNYTTVETVTGDSVSHQFAEANGRYVRIEITGYRSGYTCASMYSHEVMGHRSNQIMMI